MFTYDKKKKKKKKKKKWKPMFESQKLHDWSFLAIKTQFS